MASASNVLRIAGTSLCVILLVVPHSWSAHPVPSIEGPQLYSLGLDALDLWLGPSGLYADSELLDLYFVEDQMVAVLVKLRAAALQPDQRARLHQEAVNLFSRAQVSYDATDAFYHVVVPPPDRALCITVETEAWALRAARAMAAVGAGDANLLSRRITDGKTTLLNLLENQNHKGRPPCGGESHQLPMAVIALLEQRGPAPDARVDRVVPTVINRILGQFVDGALPSDNFYQIEVNAKLLWMLTDAAQTFPTSNFGRARDALHAFLLNHTMVPQDPGFAVLHVRREGGQLVQERQGSALNQLWLATALNHLSHAVSGSVPADRVAGILRSLLAEYWSPARGAFVSPGELISFQPNALAALISSGPIVQSMATEASELALAIPALASYVYRPQDNLMLANQWYLRFQLAGERAGRSDVLLSSGLVGDYNFTASDPLRLFRAPSGGARVPVDDVAVMGGPVQALRFGAELSSSPAGYRLEGATPLRPVSSQFEQRIELLIEHPGTDSFELRTLRLEISATDIDVRSVKINGATVPRGQYEVVAPVTTEEVQEPHTRLVVRDLLFPRGQSEIAIEYDDRTAPEIEAPTLSHDAEGRKAVKAEPTAESLQGEPLYLRAVVRDNGVLRNVLLRYQSQTNPREIIETPMQEGDNDVYTAVIPKVNQTGVARVQVVAIDAATNLNQSAPLFIDVKNPLLSGSRVLFAFSGTLFISALIIWAKVRRKPA